ncbi:MAG: hypothetical protein H0T47_24555 [Planctomycetaceae bacterium]|nr:hypothetical protein [Planctomycetaceae bacterium]
MEPCRLSGLRTQQVRLIEPVLIGGSITSKAADGTEMTAKLEKVEEKK